MHLSVEDILIFQQRIKDFYAQQGRSFAWRHTDDPYAIVVSEIMLQQTQTYRVEPKYDQFMRAFPDFAALAAAPLRQVLLHWQGLGYNRRGMALQMIAQKVIREHQGILPAQPATLETFPGIGKATAASICTFAFNMPVAFIETNIRAVFIHEFFRGSENVHDKQLMPLIEATLDTQAPRAWYYALMDYGVHLKKLYKNPARKSAHHTKQSQFEGSDRQIRGAILRLLTHDATLTQQQLLESLKKEEERVQKILDDLCAEKLVAYQNNAYRIAD